MLRKQRGTRWVALLVFATICLTQGAVVEGSPLNHLHNDSPYYSPILGLCEDYPRGTFAEDIERDFALMADYGISDMRISINWADTEFDKGYFDWWLLDDHVQLAEQYGIELYPYLCYAPTWATRAAWMSPPEHMQDWYDFVFEVVSLYKGSISQWELWNEGDNNDFWMGTWEEQLELVKVGAQAVKDADPTARTVFGGLTNLNPAHVQTIFTSGVADYIDVINIHFYNETWNPSPLERIATEVKAVADVIRRNGGKQELWVAEIGYSDYVDSDGQVSYWVRQRYPYEKTQPYQAVAFARSFTRIASTEDVSTILWYEIKNLPLYSAAIGDVNNHYLGALDFEYFPKPLWFAIASFKQLFADPFISIDRELTVDASLSQTYVHGFRRENGDVILVAWNRGLQSGEVEVTIPNAEGTIISYSPTGNKEIYTGDTSIDDSALTLDFAVHPESIIILEILGEQDFSRLALENASVTPGDQAGSFTVTSQVANLGALANEQFVLELWPSDGVQVISESRVGNTMNWEVSVTRGTPSPRAWVIVRDGKQAPAAVLLELVR